MTLEQLSAQSGVSKSMLSQIERGEANPTFAVVWSLTQALDLDFADLVGGSSTRTVDQIEVTSKTHTPVIRGEDGRSVLKILSTPRLAGRVEWYEIEIQPGASLDSEAHAPGTFEHFTAWTDRFEITSAGASAEVLEGETARYRADVAHRIANVGNAVARGLLVVLYK